MRIADMFSRPHGWRRRVLLGVFVVYLAAVGFSTFGTRPSENIDTVATTAKDVTRRVEDAARSRVGSDDSRPLSEWLTQLDAEDTGNVLMFVPFGVLVPVLWPRRHRWVVPVGVACSGLIEVTQLTVATHRSAEWEDIWWNSLGVGLGYGVWLTARFLVDRAMAR